MALSRIFRSRWAALWWSAGIVWTAVEVAGGAPSAPANRTGGDNAQVEDATGVAVNAADLAALAAAGR